MSDKAHVSLLMGYANDKCWFCDNPPEVRIEFAGKDYVKEFCSDCLAGLVEENL